MDYACHLDDIIMESEGEKGSLLLMEAESHRPTVPDLHHRETKEWHLVYEVTKLAVVFFITSSFSCKVHRSSSQIPTTCSIFIFWFLSVDYSKTTAAESFKIPFFFMYSAALQLLFTLIKIHLLFKCVRVSLGRPQGTSRGVGALGGGEHSLFFMLWVKIMLVWAGLVIWWKCADFQGTRWGHRMFCGSLNGG